MLQINKRPPASDRESDSGSPVVKALHGAVRVVRRQLPIIAVIMVCSLALALLYLFTTPPKFTAIGTMIIDTRKVQVLQQQSVLGEVQIDASTVQTQVEVLKSDNIGLAVIRKLHLTQDPEFVGPGKGLISTLMRLIPGLSGPEEPKSEFELEQTALLHFNDSRTVSRQGLTYVIDVGFTSLDPEKSANIANSIVDAYIEEQLDAKYQAAKRAGVWLMERIKELRAQATAAERAVADFKDKNNIVDTGGVGGKLVNEQQLTEVNSQLILATAAAAEAKARVDRIKAVMKQDVPDASVTDALHSEVITKLRQQFLDFSQREAILSQKYGANHLAVIGLRTQLQELKRSIDDEMRKIAGSYESDYEIARTRERALKESLANAVMETQTSGQAQVQLRELKSNADSARTLYDNFLQRYMEAVQQQDAIPISETRLISPAIRPLKKSSPKGLITLILALFGGGALSFAVAYFREASDGVLRTTDQVEDILHVNCLAMVPLLKLATPPQSPDSSGSQAGSSIPAPLRRGAGEPPVAQRQDRQRAAKDGSDRADQGSGQGESTVHNQKPAGSRDFLHYVVAAPFSRYAEAIRSVKIAADLSGVLKSHKVIGLTSTLPNEGKSTIAANLAHLIADAGGKAILVDADLRSPSLSHWLAPNAQGLIDVVIGNVPLTGAITTLPESRLHFLPAGATAKLPHTNEILASAAMKSVIDALRSAYDYIIVDLSPVAPIVDVRTTGHIIDTYVYVIEWGQTKIDVVERGLSDVQPIYDRLLGVVLNKVDTAAQNRYESYHGNHYHRKYYSKYGYVE
ncbi:polysaccharide biosynthesis tyrosine autokinase [Methylocapsa acidiphila]|uniref:polysaccharide biosynthesis tyrosine autokinase n=1 Tax=Methylocapsa acidiphila TaxID=133552 RepID=UPI00047969E0|nr:polysaccharide biosynthesis tyrosine autokinase [Methylocapsa acidiphila]